MKRAIPGLTALLLSPGCLQKSEVELDVFVRQDVVASVEQFPVRILLDIGLNQNREIHICEEIEGFIQTSLPVMAYDRCPAPLTLRGVLVPLTDPCSDLLQVTEDWPAPGTVVYGAGAIDVFESGDCNTVEQRRLTIEIGGPVDNPSE